MFSFLVQTISPATLQSCSVTCSHMNVIAADSCNINYVENSFCTAGILDHPYSYSKPNGSSLTLVPVKIIESMVAQSAGFLVKPGNMVFHLLVSKLGISTQLITE